MNPIAATASTAVATRSRTWLRHAGLAISGSLVVAIAAHIAVPLYFTPVPFTLQTLAVLAVGLVLGPTVAFSAMMLYLLEAASGLPVLSPVGIPGPLHIFGPDAGYLLSYPFAALAAGWLYRRARNSRFLSNFTVAIASAAIGDAIIFACGAAWIADIMHLSPAAAASLAIVPFLPGDALKVILAAAIVTGITRFRKHSAAE